MPCSPLKTSTVKLGSRSARALGLVESSGYPRRYYSESATADVIPVLDLGS